VADVSQQLLMILWGSGGLAKAAEEGLYPLEKVLYVMTGEGVGDRGWRAMISDFGRRESCATIAAR
jgi:hypothetical protein